jgi:spermidine synthase
MIRYEFLIEATSEQTLQIIGLYQAEGWWSADDKGIELVEKIIKGSHCFVAALEDNRIVGMGRAISDGVSDAYIQDVAVSEVYRKRAIGSGIIKHIVARLNADGLHWIGLIAERNAHDFYRPLGFDAMPDAMPMLRTK